MGLLSDLWELGQGEIRQAADRALNSQGTSAHIGMQNSAHDEMARVLAEFNAGARTNASAQTAIERINAAFQMYVQRLGYARALQGGMDINTLAQRILSDLRLLAETRPTIPGTTIPRPDIYDPGEGPSWATIGLIGIAAFFFLGRR